MTATSAFWRKASFGLLVRGGTRRRHRRDGVAISVPASAQFSSTSAIRSSIRARAGAAASSIRNRPTSARRISRARRLRCRASRMPRQITTKILVLGDSMADWLAYGLDDALAETPEIGVIRKHKSFLRPDPLRSAAGRAGMAAGRARIDRGGKTASRHHDDRRAGPSGDAREDRAEAGQNRPMRSPPTKAARSEARRSRSRMRKPDAQKPDAQTAQKPTRRKKPRDPADDEQQPNIAAPEPQRGARTAPAACTNITPKNGKSFTTSASTRRSRR